MENLGLHFEFSHLLYPIRQKHFISILHQQNGHSSNAMKYKLHRHLKNSTYEKGIYAKITSSPCAPIMSHHHANTTHLPFLSVI